MTISFLKNNTMKLKAFTLLETLVSIGILTVIVIGPLSVIMSSSSYARQAKDVMIATSLAEESIELLQNQYDSIYIFCKKQPDDAFCSTSTGETSGQIAWRIFKDRLSATGGQPSCYLADNAEGCSYSYQNMIGDIKDTPIRYVSDSEQCPYLVEATVPVTLPDNGGISYRRTYVCQGITSPGVNSKDIKPFIRSVVVERIEALFEAGNAVGTQYNDDLRIISQVKVQGSNGLLHTTKIIRFMHQRP